jgi:hypothetical protein
VKSKKILRLARPELPTSHSSKEDSVPVLCMMLNAHVLLKEKKRKKKKKKKGKRLESFYPWTSPLFFSFFLFFFKVTLFCTTCLVNETRTKKRVDWESWSMDESNIAA